MTITFTPLHPVIGAECSGVDISRTLTPAEAEAIDAGMDRYGGLVFRQGVPLTTEAADRVHAELWRTGGAVYADPGGYRHAWDNPALSDISNISPAGGCWTGTTASGRRTCNQMGTADSSYKRFPARISLLCAHVLPPEGGDNAVRRTCEPLTTCWTRRRRPRSRT